METSKQPMPLKGLSQFLVEHEHCGSGFDVSHPDGVGSGRVSMRCRGCGATHEYATTTIEFEREVEFAPFMLETPSDAAPPPPWAVPQQADPDRLASEPAQKITEEIEAVRPPTPPPPPSGTTFLNPRTPPGPRHAGYWTRNRKITAGLIAFAIAALTFAAVRILGGGEDSTSTPVPAPPAPGEQQGQEEPGQANSGPTPATGQGRQAQDRNQAGKQGQGGSRQPAAQAEPTPTADEQVIETERFTLIVPSTWEQRQAAGGFVLAPPGDTPVSVQVYFEDDPDMGMQTMIFQTASFLRSRDAQARVQQAQRFKVDGSQAFKMRARGPAGTQVALGVLADPYRYLVIESLDPEVTRTDRKEAERALATFRPR